MLFRSGVPLRVALCATREELGSEPEVGRLVDFIEESLTRKGICSPAQGPARISP
jgi:hypothetical protein